MPDFRYEIPVNKIAHEMIDGEVVVLQFDTGFYFSLNSPAARLWQWMVEGANRQEMLDAFEVLQPDQVASFDTFLDLLVAEKLLNPVKVENGHSSATSIPKHELTFERPAMEKYGDMQDLLLADPIHEVDEAGWPSRPPVDK